ncbi:MAG: tRNA (N6-isopentenyl adenosine(37)-C2)-methylthiotransferase MiaB [Clostridia bacterium]|nr:tRNA (N6-isopentenyl adenosine(37)-C2)-methylthiotransferase MiaB [Clostridia bacterium]
MSIFSSDVSYPTEQQAYAEKVRRIITAFGKTAKACVVTYGCQQNVNDSQRLKGMLRLMGYEITETEENADFIIFNTCAVREHAEDRVFGNVGATKKLKRENKNLIVAVCGCMAQQKSVADKFKESYPYVDIVFGTQVSHRLPEFVYKRLTGGKRIFELELKNEKIVEGVPIDREDRFKGYIPITYGCDNFCTYCIVPYVRGRERSRAAGEILKEAKQMVDSGYKEIMLLGQNVNSYGKGNADGINFAKLLRMINDIKGDFIIRFMTSHPKDCTEELLDAMRDCEKVERHLHLPFQSGSDRVLGAMNRRYTREKYLSLIKAARERMPDISFTTDIIVGFPGETYEEFCETLSLIKEVEFSSAFTFIYSKRQRTPAAVMPDPVSRKEKGEWFSLLLKEQDKISKKLNNNLVGQTVRVLIEEPSPEEGFLIGRSGTALNIYVEGEKDLIGTFKNVKINSYTNVLYGTVVE